MPVSIQRFSRRPITQAGTTTWVRILAVALDIALGPSAAGAAEAPARLIVHEVPREVPEISFKDDNGRPVALADLRGKIVVLNVWATWCSPCREEMPALDRLQAQFDRKDVEVVALSIDRKGLDPVRKFLASVGVRHLPPYIDESGGASRSLGLVGLPGTLVIDRDGREIGRLLGAAEWDSPETVEFLKARVEQGKTIPAQEPAL
ncbi:TlpA family protein disulfide reductase [Microvirga splendida]|uniref:TlpA family protein disulfide reductase n=1 Tax=Microvirga splendida TaxID=2795727 RepID=A0ABS0Y7Y8_9HYPH|nr:TlpA disulfide reductase family protein [Microvirga splendida]MBJ6128425.1 TlpA family protein disulfide reductase [Microvirga splendida]